jgi:hypothetical protein
VVSTRLSMPCTYDTAKAPSEWPMIASLLVRPGVTDLRSLRRSSSFQNGLNELTLADPALGFLYGFLGVDSMKSVASIVP